MKSTNSNTENLNSKEKTKNVPKAHVESPAQISNRWEETENRVQKNLAELSKWSEEEIRLNFFKLQNDVIKSKRERVIAHREDVKQAVSDRLNEWGVAAQLKSA